MQRQKWIGLVVFLSIVASLAACSSSTKGAGGTTVKNTVDPSAPRHRYSFNNKCVALRANNTNLYVTTSGTGYAASANVVANAEPFYMKPSALGEYLLYNRAGQLMNGAATVNNVTIAAATDSAIFSVKADGDGTTYPIAPQFDVAPTAMQINTYRNFVDPLVENTVFVLTQVLSQQRLTNPNGGALTTTAGNTPNQRFRLEEVTGCAEFPEAHDNTTGETFTGTTADGRVLGIADEHVHTSSSTFLGGALSGQVFHKFGVQRAMPDCAAVHGPQGSNDVLGAAFLNDTNGHPTAGWPLHTDWPRRDALTHRGIYWKWIERAWKGGLRIMVNDLVENATLCELQRNVAGKADLECNEMNSARRQVGTMYALQDYIDAQFGGRGKGFLQIVLTPAEARTKIAAGKMATVLGMEISNLFNCQLTYNPLRTKEPFEEPMDAVVGGTENTYACKATETGAANEIKTQLVEMKNLGVRQIITIHEFDNAFGGNGIFDDLVLNLGNRENSGGIPGGTLSGPFAATFPPESASGEFWTTYDCPEVSATSSFTGYLWNERMDKPMQNLGPPPPVCPYTGQGGRPGGTTACYPAKIQCNARWLTPIGLYTYKKLMEEGIIFDIDHLEHEMKTQALELAEAQPIAYPFVSTHGAFGGTSNDQAKRMIRNGGHLFPSIGSINGFISDMNETKNLKDGATLGGPVAGLFGFGFGTDTDGLSAQTAPRNPVPAGRELRYPFTLFTGAPFNQLPDFAGKRGVVFNQPEERNAAGQGRTWHEDQDGNAHYGMMADTVQEMRLEGTPAQMQALFNSAEVYLRTWEKTLESSAAINANGGAVTPAGILRAAPKPAAVLPVP